MFRLYWDDGSVETVVEINFDAIIADKRLLLKSEYI